MTVSVIAGGRGGVFMPAGIRWKVERTFAWMSRYRRLNSSSIASRSTSLRMPGSPSVRLSLAESPVSSLPNGSCAARNWKTDSKRSDPSSMLLKRPARHDRGSEAIRGFVFNEDSGRFRHG
jgi:hypothetical protein